MSRGASPFRLCSRAQVEDLAGEFFRWYQAQYPGLVIDSGFKSPEDVEDFPGKHTYDKDGISHIIVDVGYGMVGSFDLDNVVKAIVSTAHECRHAYQSQYLMQTKSKLGQRMAIDQMACHGNAGYYISNYNMQSFEADAIAASYLLARDFFRDKMAQGHPLLRRMRFNPAFVEDSMLETINDNIRTLDGCKFGVDRWGNVITHYNRVNDYVRDALNVRNNLANDIVPGMVFDAKNFARDNIMKYKSWFGEDSAVVHVIEHGTPAEQRLAMAAVRSYLDPKAFEMREALQSVSWECDVGNGRRADILEEVENHPRLARFAKARNAVVERFGLPAQFAAELGVTEDDAEQDDAASWDMEM